MCARWKISCSNFSSLRADWIANGIGNLFGRHISLVEWFGCPYSKCYDARAGQPSSSSDWIRTDGTRRVIPRQVLGLPVKRGYSPGQPSAKGKPKLGKKPAPGAAGHPPVNPRSQSAPAIGFVADSALVRMLLIPKRFTDFSLPVVLHIID